MQLYSIFIRKTKSVKLHYSRADASERDNERKKYDMFCVNAYVFLACVCVCVCVCVRVCARARAFDIIDFNCRDRH